MKLQEVIDNLNRTIAGKEYFRSVLLKSNPPQGSANEAMVKIADINIEELTKIRDDLLKVEA